MQMLLMNTIIAFFWKIPHDYKMLESLLKTEVVYQYTTYVYFSM